MPDDYYVSQYSGEEIDALLGGAGAGTVRYDAAQTLTDAQKTQARENIAAAPGGYGFGGEYISRCSATGSDETYESFCTRLDEIMAGMPSNSVRIMGVYPPQIYGLVSNTCSLVYQNADGYCGVYNLGMPDSSCSQWRMIKNNSVWQPFEWVNPPMQLGVEYRTTERYLGKPVYVKKVNFGNAPAGSVKEVSCATNVSNMVDFNLTVWNGSFAQENTIISDDGTLVARPYSKLADGTLSIALAVFEDISTRSVDLVVKYTKTTD